MLLNEAYLAYQTRWFEAGDCLSTTKQLLRFLTIGIPDGPESLWIACMNPNHRPICRVRIKTGVLVATQVHPREVFLPIMLSEARGFACLRTQVDGRARPNLADGQLAWRLRETARQLDLQFADYIVTRLDTGEYYSSREHDGHAL